MKILDSKLERTTFTTKELITDNTPKILFIGRSNVGKSSLINKLVNRKKLALTSSRPGKTVSVNYYRIESSSGTLFFVDLPGYGYARISKSESQRVKNLLSDFFDTVRNARLIVLLIDSRRGFMDSDLEIVGKIMDKKINLLTVLTKSDKLRFSDIENQKRNLQNKFGLNAISFTIKSDENKEEMLNIINKALVE